MPVLGVAASDWDDAALRQQSAMAIRAAEPGADPEVLAALTGRLSMVAGDYRDPATFDELARRCAGLGIPHPVHYLAIPRIWPGRWSAGWPGPGCAMVPG